MKKILLIYSSFFILFSFISFFYIDQNFIYLNFLYTGFSLNFRILSAILYFLFITVFFVIYYFLLTQKDIDIKKLRWYLLVPCVGLFAYPAILSFDIFNYVTTSKVAFHYLENPYIIMPIDFQGDPVLMFTRAANKTALYGPLWVGLTSVPFYLSLGNYLFSIVLFKLLVAFFYFGILYIIWKSTKTPFNVVFFAASPLVLIETFISGHNDVVMMFLAVASIFALRRKRIFIAISLLIMSVLIKYATIFLVPLFIYYFYLRFKNKQIDWDSVYFTGFILMTIIFFLSAFREEIYPWYAIWPLAFISFIADKKKYLRLFVIFFSYCLMLRYLPFMATGNYFGITPAIKIVITFIFPGIFIFILFLRKNFKVK